MSHFLFLIFLLSNAACLEPCKNGYGRAADKLCYPLADDPVEPCGEGMARNDDGACVSTTGGSGSDDGSGETGSDDGSGGESTGSTVSGDDGGTGGTTGSGEGGGTTSGGGGESTGGDGVGTTTGGGAAGASATFKGVLNTTDGAGFEEGDEILIQAWSEGTIDETTGLPIPDTTARATQVSGSAVTALSIHFEFIITDIPEEGEALRLTAHLTEDPLEWEDSPVGMHPIDIAEWIVITPDDFIDGINIVIDNGGDGTGGGSPPDGGTPPDTGLPPLDGGPSEG